MVKDQEYKQLEKLYEAERHKTMTLLKQIEELNAANSQLTMQNNDSKRRLISLDLVSLCLPFLDVPLKTLANEDQGLWSVSRPVLFCFDFRQYSGFFKWS